MIDVPKLVEHQLFTPVRLREGYDAREVDDFLDLVVETWEAGEPLAPLIDAAHFSTGRLREGYRAPEVDEFLETLRMSA